MTISNWGKLLIALGSLTLLIGTRFRFCDWKLRCVLRWCRDHICDGSRQIVKYSTTSWNVHVACWKVFISGLIFFLSVWLLHSNFDHTGSLLDDVFMVRRRKWLYHFNHNFSHRCWIEIGMRLYKVVIKFSSSNQC